MFMTVWHVILIYQQFIDASVPWKESVFSDLIETQKVSCVTDAPDPSSPITATSDARSAGKNSPFPANYLTYSFKWLKKRAVFK